MEKKLKKYVVIWHYMANYGDQVIYAESPEAAKKAVWNGRQDLEFFVAEKDAMTVFRAKKG